MKTNNSSDFVPLIERIRMAKRFMRVTAFVEIFFFLFVFYTPSVQATTDYLAEKHANNNSHQVIQGKTNEEKLANTLQAIKENVSHTKNTINNRIVNEGGLIDRVLAFFNLSELQKESLDRLLDLKTQVEALNQKALANFSATEADLKAKGLPEEILEQHYRVVTQYKADFLKLQNYINQCQKAGSLHDQQKAFDDIDVFLEKNKFKSEHQSLDPNNLPWGNPNADDTRQPKTTPKELSELITGKPNSALALATAVLDAVVTPAHAGGLPTAEDLAETPDVQISDQMVRIAQYYNNDPVEIYNWVRNNIEFIPTYGSIQGANYTLQSAKGNAFDTASLLIALLRAADVPARYAYGTVSIPADQVMNWVGGVTVPAAAQQLLGQGGIPNSAVVQGGVISHIEMEHVWVEAWVDFEPGRGAKNAQGDTWIPLDASFKQYTYSEPALDTSGFNYDGQALIESLSSSPLGDPALETPEFDIALDNMLVAFNSLLDTQTPDGDINKQLGDKIILAQEFKTLSPDLPYQLIAQSNSYSVIPDELRHKFRYQLGSEDLSNPYIAYEVSLPEIAGNQLSVSFQPASVQDTAVLESFLPSSDTATINDLPSGFPGYLINLRAQFNVNGVPVSDSQSNIFMLGQQIKHSVALYSPNGGWKQRDAKGYAGEHRAIGLDLQGFKGREIEQLEFDLATTLVAIDNGEKPSKFSITEKFTQQGINYYFALNNRFDRQQSKPSNIINYRLPSFGYLHTALTPIYTFGVPVSVNLSGVAMDVPLISKTVVAKDNNTTTKLQYNRTNGLISSYLENWVPEQLLDIGAVRPEGVSAAKIMEVAASQGQQIHIITLVNQAELASVNIDPATRQDLINAINAGKEVTVHEAPVTINGWIGSGYFAIDTVTGAGGYIISGGANGGFLNDSTIGSLMFLLSMGLDFIPGLGSIKAIIELMTGVDLITGEPISRWLAAAAIFGVAGFAIAAILKLLAKAAKFAAKEIKILLKESAVNAAEKGKVWGLSDTVRGNVIESQLAKTEYKDWFNVGSLDNGYFPLVDFQKGTTLVSLKTVDTTGTTWLARMRDHIQELGSNRATIDGNPANMILDIRVQPGGAADAQQLIDFGANTGVTVIIKEF